MLDKVERRPDGKHARLLFDENQVLSFQLMLERRQNAANVHRVVRAKQHLNRAWIRYRNHMDDESYHELERAFVEAEGFVWG